LSQAQLSEAARRVLEVDEESFKVVVRELARSELFAKHYTRKNRLADTHIVLGHIRKSGKGYVPVVDVADVPLCRENYGDGRGVFHVDVTAFGLELRFHCIAGHTSLGMSAATMDNGQATVSPWRLYRLHEFLYKELGTGARPLLELARKAEEEGGGDVAGVLRKLYAILEASGDIVREIEQADYSRVAEEEVEKQAERKAEEALRLLRRAKELARKGDTKGLRELLEGIKVIEAQPRGITLDDIIYYLRTGWEDNIKNLLSTYPYTPWMLNIVLREEDIYDVFITVAEHLGLEIKRP